MSPDIPTCGMAKSISSLSPPRDTRRFYSWMVFTCIIGLIIWSAVGTGTDLRVFLHADAWFQMATFAKSLFPPDFSREFVHNTLWSGMETIALSIMGTALAVLIALPLGIKRLMIPFCLSLLPLSHDE